MIDLEKTIRITEIFYSLQGESLYTGIPTVFVRLTGCPLRCHYCDTAYAFTGGKRQSLKEIIQKVKSFDCPYVCITGGEPLAQPNVLLLMQALADKGFTLSLETSGALDIKNVDKRVMVVMDLKTPDSGEAEKNLLLNVAQLKPTDQIKFVLCSENDYAWALALIEEHQLKQHAQILFSPSHEQLNPGLLASWIIRDKLQVRFQVQLHKILEIP